ncbi:PLASTID TRANSCRIPTIONALLY ACTIVE PROTEIN [Salix koriyanagi]|uniref:PLASTID TRANSCRIPTIONALLY ACTIVE PROTEIN n=1 Tax=Salix koriyanagi TaxID=2511006 RepID=A0A9Q0U5Z1_9ROSI|nr:PLASTID TRANSCRIPTIONALLY ACTIVE PROTEIN [Salix koriyanagi]
MAVSAAAATLQTAARLEQLQLDSAKNSKKTAVVAGKEEIFGTSRRSPHHLSLTKPSWVVRTESNIRREIRKRPDPPCEVCHGTGRVDCPPCSGQGRINSVRLAMLPKGEWPKWCRTCGGSGLSYCSRCLGTGEYRYIMGFHFMMASDDTKNHPQQHQSTAARPLNGEDLDSNHGI